MAIALKETLEHALNEACGVLISDYGFVLSEGDYAFCLVSEFVEIRVAYNFNYVHTTLKMRFAGIVEEQSFVDIYDVLAALAPHLSEADRYPKEALFSDTTIVEVNRHIRLIVEWCKPLLRGDYSAWSKVTQYLQEERSLWHPRDGESEVDYLNRLRTVAYNAYQRQEYWAASRLYDYMSSCVKLTRDDRRRLSEAKKHIFTMR